MSDFEKLYKFDGCNYTVWVDKMKFLLIALKVFYVLDPNLSPIPEVNQVGGENAKEKVIADDREKQRKEDEALCYKYIKNSLSGRLCDLYCLPSNNNDPRLLWKALEDDFKANENVTNKHLVQYFLDYHMVDGKSTMEQVHEFHTIVKRLKDSSIIIPEVFHIVSLITKLPPSWKDIANTMMLSKYENLSVNDLLKQIRLEERAKKRTGTKTLRGDHGLSKKRKLGVKKPNSNFKKTAPHCKVPSDAIDAAQLADLMGQTNIIM